MDVQEFNKLLSMLEQTVSDIGMSVRLATCVKNAHGADVPLRYIATMSKAEFQRIPGVGPKLVQEIEEILSNRGLALGMNAAQLPGYKGSDVGGKIKKYRQLVLSRDVVLQAIQRVAERGDTRTAEFLHARFGLKDENDFSRSISEIASTMNVTEARVQQIQQKALRRLGRDLIKGPVSVSFVEWITGYDLVSEKT